MKTELLPIIAAYLGQKCSYDGGTFETLGTWELENFGMLPDHNFKLHLRKPQSITNEELRTLSGIVCGIEYEPESFPDGSKSVGDYDNDDIVIMQPNGVIELGALYSCQFARTTNYLRRIGICVDKELIDEGLVKFDGEKVRGAIEVID